MLQVAELGSIGKKVYYGTAFILTYEATLVLRLKLTAVNVRIQDHIHSRHSRSDEHIGHMV